MKRREFITLFGGAAAWPVAARGQPSGGWRRGGVLMAGLTEKDPQGQLRISAFRRELQNPGWAEGRNVEVIERWPGGSAERLRAAGARGPQAQASKFELSSTLRQPGCSALPPSLLARADDVIERRGEFIVRFC